MKDHWGSYECLACEGGTVFDVRFNESYAQKRVYCPLCGGLCKLRSQWESDDGGYGSRGDMELGIVSGREEIIRRVGRIMSDIHDDDYSWRWSDWVRNKFLPQLAQEGLNIVRRG